MMTLDELARGMRILERSGRLPEAVAGLHYDSRQVQPGWAFVAIPGERLDGNAFIPQALERGASVIFSERPPQRGLPWLRVANARQALAEAAANWFGRPAEKLKLIGVTGTNGKTTTSWLIEAMLRQAGWTTGLLGTIEYHIGTAVLPAPHTTPESYDLHHLLARMVEAGCQAAAMEVSSHALALERTWGCGFEAAVFTNLTQDHLDFHGTMENYAAAKRRLFQGRGAAAPRAAVVNADDEHAAAMLHGYEGRVYRFGFGADAEGRGSNLANEAGGMRFALHGPGGFEAEVRCPLVGRVNALNALAALGVGWALGLDPAAMVEGAARWPRVRGRFEAVTAGQPFTVLVDYAHTPDALHNVLALAREMAAGGRVLAVFGCGGDRDRGKRMLMGRAAQAGADWVTVTSDNPRTEDPMAIIHDVVHGVKGFTGCIEPDRRTAIRAALAEAKPGEVVVIAGKGHEAYQIVGEERIHFDDAEEAREGLRTLGYGT
jgi:UDP-N-acetylmuramoyl-L-alanyl-D-glutamate--2,6-diaminopimelate ligase